MNKKSETPTIITEGKNSPPIRPSDIPPQNRTGYNHPPVGERPVKPVITPPPPPKKKE